MRRALSIAIAVVFVCGVVVASSISGLITLPQFDLASFFANNRLAGDETGERQSPPVPQTARIEQPPGKTGEVAAATQAEQPPEALPAQSAAVALKIEVARVDPDGATVLAGRAPANSKVTLYGNGQALVTTVASGDGQWSAVVTKRFAPGPLEFSITADPPSGGSIRGPALAVMVPKAANLADLAVAPAGPRPILPPKASVVESRAISELAALVERARESAGQNSERPGAAAPATVPVPITFVTGEATMTPQGMRAADLLVEYVRIMAPKTMTLSGHADMRGGDAYNLELSRQRLEAIEQYLRSRGYAGRLSLLPKGKSEPFAGIDRTSASHEAVLQADRRVELRLIE